MDEFGQITGNHTKVSGNQEEFLTLLHGLRAATDVEFQKEVCGVGLDGVDGHEKFVGDLLVGVAFGHELEDFVLTFADAELFEAHGVELEVGNLDVDDLPGGELQARPNTYGGEEYGEDACVEFERQVTDEEAVLEELQRKDQRRQGEAV